MFKAILLTKTDAGSQAQLTNIDDADLPQGDVTVKIDYSTINYKDGLAITGKAPIARKFPMIPGIDFAGIVEASQSPLWKAGDKVILNGWNVGEDHWGGLAQKARVKGEWLVPLPAAFTTKQAAAIGTAGYTAILCVLALEKQGVTPDKGEIIVTGAAGGVGSIAIALLAKRSYNVVASTGRIGESDYLKSLGAKEIIDRATLSAPGKPLAKERWAGAVDTVGSHTLANICASTKYMGVVTACGLAQGMDFSTTVAPFILRGVTLVGINSVLVPQATRLEAWSRLASDLDQEKLNVMTEEISLQGAIDKSPEVLAGRVRGRLVVNVNA